MLTESVGVFMTFQLFVPVLLFAAVALCFKLAVGRAGGNRRDYQQFIQDEHESNFARPKPIPDSLVVVADAHFLNQADFTTYPDDMPEHTQTTLEALRVSTYQKSQAYMVRLDKSQRNLDLKMRYGVANLDKLIAGDEHLHHYLHALNSYAEVLIKHQLVSQAKTVLTHAINDMGSDLAKSQELLRSL